MAIILLIQRLKNWIASLLESKPFTEQKNMNLPENISDDEHIVRYIFSPRNFNPKTNKLRTNTFTSPEGMDEVSVIRFNFCDENYCKTRAKSMSSTQRIYIGMAILTAKVIRSCKCDVVSSPIIDNPTIPNTPEHADIVVGCIRTGQELPAEFAYNISLLTERAQFYLDPNPESEIWEGEALAYIL
jgi:hypothetical protein